MPYLNVVSSRFRLPGKYPKNPLGFVVKPAEKKTAKTRTKLNSISVCHAVITKDLYVYSV